MYRNGKQQCKEVNRHLYAPAIDLQTIHLNVTCPEGVGQLCTKRHGQRSRTVREDWFAWLPEEMDQLFGATRNDLECFNGILSVALDEALGLCEQEQSTIAKERVAAFAGLFDRLAIRLRLVIRTIEEHGSHFGTLPNVSALASENFRGTTAQRIAFMDNLLAKVVFRGRMRFVHKLHALKEIIEELQKETRVIVDNVSERAPLFPERIWRKLEVLWNYLNTCMGETTVVLKSFFCALPAEELEAFRQKLLMQVPTILTVSPRRT